MKPIQHPAWPDMDLIPYPNKTAFAVFAGDTHLADIAYSEVRSPTEGSGALPSPLYGVRHTRAWMQDERVHPGVPEPEGFAKAESVTFAAVAKAKISREPTSETMTREERIARAVRWYDEARKRVADAQSELATTEAAHFRAQDAKSTADRDLERVAQAFAAALDNGDYMVGAVPWAPSWERDPA